MYKIQTLNAISDVIHEELSAENYLIGKEEPVPEGILVRSADMHERELPESLLAIARAGAGTNNIPIDECTRRGIAVFNTPGANANAVAELAISLLFSCARSISIAGHTMRENKWEKKAYSKGFEVSGKTVGVIGYGRIGRMVGDKCQALGAKVLSVVHRTKPEGCECETMHFVSMDELLSQSDIVILCAPGGDKAIVDAEALAKMKDGVVIINTSRGTNVDEAALLAGLESGKVRAAGLDVYADEPATNKALYSHPMVSCTPHIGAATVEAQKRIGAEIVDIISKM